MTGASSPPTAESLFESGKRFLLASRNRSADAELAVRYFEQAADLGFAPAQRLLGVCYLQGHAVTRNYRQARRWLTLAAEQNDPSAAYNLALMHAQGLGAEKNWSLAHGLLSRPELGGLPEAVELKRRLKEELIKLHPKLVAALELDDQLARAALTPLLQRRIQPFLSEARTDDDHDEFEIWLNLNLGRLSLNQAYADLGRRLHAYYRRMLEAACPPA
jgi:TPR repeat protein